MKILYVVKTRSCIGRWSSIHELIGIYIPIASINGLVSGKKNRKFLIFHGKIRGFRWRCSLICQAIESLDSYGPLSCPPIEVTTAWNSCDLVQAASTHTLLWLEWTPRWTSIPHGFPMVHHVFFWEWLFSETIFGDCLDKTMRLMNCIIYLHLGYLWVKWWLFVGFLLDFFTSNSPELTSSRGPVELKIHWDDQLDFYDLAHRTRCFLVFRAISCDQGRKFLQCPDPQKKQNCLKLWPCYNHICVLSCYFLFFLNTISFDTVG